MAATDLLLIVDAPGPFGPVVSYAVNLLDRRRGARACLLCLLPNLPPNLLEFGGAENPRREHQLDNQLKQRQAEWVDAMKRKTQPALQRATTTLRAAGLPTGNLRIRFSEPGAYPTAIDELVEDILALARAGRYGTVVVRRTSQMRAQGDLLAALVERGTAVTVCLVK